MLELLRTRLAAAARGLPRPQDLLGFAGQRLDAIAGRLTAGLQRNVSAHAHALAGPAARLNPERLLAEPIQRRRQRLGEIAGRLGPVLERRLAREAERLRSLERQRVSLNPEGPLKRGYALVRRSTGSLALSAKDLASGEIVRLKFHDGERGAAVDRAGVKRPAKSTVDPAQGDLF
jgi:exodeoxyribonuclease VII large subunit